MQRGEWESGSLRGKFMLRINDRYIVEKVLKFVQQTKDTGVAEETLMSQTVGATLPRSWPI